jgi:uncharacterized protein (TIGR02594 family)
MAALPAKYQWLRKLRGLPRTITLALAEYGTREVVGKGSNRTIIGWRDELNQAGVKITGFTDDDIPWCGLFAAIVAYRRKKLPAEVVKDPLWARNWAKYGKQAGTAQLGDILVFQRGSGGHVGFYVAEDKTAYHVLGGNQSNAVTIARIAKNRCIAVRRPDYVRPPFSIGRYHVSAGGTLSTDEA